MANTNYIIMANTNGTISHLANVTIDFERRGNDEIVDALASLIQLGKLTASSTITVTCDSDSYGSDGFVGSWQTDAQGSVIQYSQTYSRGGFEIPADAVFADDRE